jgi:hypothetical protein
MHVAIEAGVRSAIRRAIKAGKVRYLSDIPGFSDLPKMTMQVFLHERLTSPSNSEALRHVGMSDAIYQKWRLNKTFVAVYEQVLDRTYHIESRNLVLMLDRTVDKLGFLLESTAGSPEDERLHQMYLRTIKELRELIKEDGVGPKRSGKARKGFDAVPVTSLAPVPAFDTNGKYLSEGTEVEEAEGDIDDDGDIK